VDGSTKAISVATSSGFAGLDEAATKCVATWKYQPAMQSGCALEVDRKATVEWSMAAAGKAETVIVTRGSKPPPQSAIAPTQQPIGSHVCKNPIAPPAPLGKMTVVSYYLHRDGSVDHVKLFRSSGDDKLDALALECASEWRFTPLPEDAPRVLIFSISKIPW
jgi:TonB family protein